MVWYNRGKFIILDASAAGVGEAPLALLLDRVIIPLMRAAYSIDIDAHGQFGDAGVSTNEIVATSYTARGNAIQLATKATTQNDTADRAEFDADDLQYTGIGNGTNDTFDAIIIAREQDAGATDANTELIAHTAVNPTLTNGGNVTLVFDGAGILHITA